MWRTPDGHRVLKEPEWALFAVGVDVLWNWIESDIDSGDDDANVGLVAFDGLTPEQKVVMLANVANAFRNLSIRTPKLTASNEATIAAVFAVIRGVLECDIAVIRGVLECRQKIDAFVKRKPSHPTTTLDVET